MDLFRLSPEAEARAAATRQWQIQKERQFASMTNESLVANAKFYASQMEPLGFAPGEPIYEATMWHVILPELIRRLDEQNDRR